ncbi:MAG: hypothetical protein PHW54_03530 [Candidatus Omnitrophica bacterium]|nr:hypothetical protein [Candidatus Omnitrophota bacterium]
MRKEELYKRIKVAGMISFIPVMLAAGPFMGYIAGDYLVKKTGVGYILFVCIGIGFIASITEVIKIIRLVTKLTDKSSG